MDIYEPGPDVHPHLVTVCPETVLTKSNLKGNISNQHEVTPTKLAPFQCSECYTSKQLTKVFSTRGALSGHIQQCHAEPRFKCQVCFKPFTRLSNLKQHNHVHSFNPDNNKNKCDFCQSTFIAKCHLNRHLFNVHKQKVKGVKYFKCEFYSQEFASRYYLEKHVVEEHVVDKEFGCPTCSKTFIDQHNLDQHMKKHDVEDIRYFCQVCSNKFETKSKLSKHIKNRHNQFHCSKCFTTLSNKLEFDHHLNPKTALQFKCGICSNILSSQCNLTIHTNSHLKAIKVEQVSEINTPKFKHQFDGGKVKLLSLRQSTKPEPKLLAKINCDLCFKSFNRESNFKSHRNKVHPKTMWTCNLEQCSKKFKYYCQLKDHRVIHLKYKSYKCAICPQYFSLLRKVERHVANRHKGPMPFKCPVKNCGAHCFNYSNLHRHSACHQTENNSLLKCNICTQLKTFRNSRALKRHLRLHSNVTLHGNSMTRKACDDPVFVCTSKKCFFQTRSEKEVALHYNQQHGLPTVALSKNVNIKIEINMLE